MLVPKQKQFRGPQWNPEYPAKQDKMKDESVNAPLDSRWINMSRLVWGMFDASATLVNQSRWPNQTLARACQSQNELLQIYIKLGEFSDIPTYFDYTAQQNSIFSWIESICTR